MESTSILTLDQNTSIIRNILVLYYLLLLMQMQSLYHLTLDHLEACLMGEFSRMVSLKVSV